MAKDETASKRSAEVARAYARYTINLQRAFNDLVPKLNHAYGQPAGDAAEMLSQHAVALRAIAGFLNRMGPDYLAHFAEQFIKLAQALNDLNEVQRAFNDLLLKLERAYEALESDPNVISTETQERGEPLPYDGRLMRDFYVVALKAFVIFLDRSASMKI
jgi:hypothetical protein